MKKECIIIGYFIIIGYLKILSFLNQIHESGSEKRNLCLSKNILCQIQTREGVIGI